MRNLNIKDDEAFEIATRLAKRTGQSLKLVVKEALQERERMLTRGERYEKIMEISKRCGPLWPKELRDENPDDFLYDKMGLPK